MKATFFLVLAVCLSAVALADEPKSSDFNWRDHVSKKPNLGERVTSAVKKLESEAAITKTHDFHYYMKASEPSIAPKPSVKVEPITVEAEVIKWVVPTPPISSASTPTPVDRLTTLKAAYAAGKTIQLWSQEKQNWFDVIGEPRWNSRPELYQVKPETDPVEAPRISASPEQQARWIAEAREAAKPKPDPYVEAMRNMPQILEERRQRQALEEIADKIEWQNRILFQMQYGQK